MTTAVTTEGIRVGVVAFGARGRGGRLHRAGPSAVERHRGRRECHRRPRRHVPFARATQHVELRPDDVLVLYTDALTDAPPAQKLTVHEIADVVVSGSATTDELCDAIGELARARRPGGAADDVAIIAVRFGSVSSPQPIDDAVATASA